MYLAVIIVVFAATYGLLKVCERLSHEKYARLTDAVPAGRQGQGESS